MNNPMRVAMARRFILLLTLIAAACDAGTEPSMPSALDIVAGHDQLTAAGATAPMAPAVVVRDQHGGPMRGVPVSFAVTAGGGTVEHASATTDADGRATAGAWRLGTRAGLNVLEASVAGVASATFHATGMSGPAARIALVDGAGQIAPVASALTLPPAVRVLDAHDNPVEGAVVRFTSTAAFAMIDGGTQVTDAQGIARVGSWTLGRIAGSQTLDANVEGVAPFGVLVTATPGPAHSMGILSGNAQIGTVATALGSPLTVVIRDIWGNAVSDVPITFEVTGGGGYILGSVQGEGTEVMAGSTDPDGVARVVQWVLGTVAGANTMRATSPPLGASVTFLATARAGIAVEVLKHDGDGQTAPAGSFVTTAPSVLVRDAFNNPVPGTVIQFAVTSGGGALGSAAATADGTGVASAGSWLIGSGTNTVVATLADVGSVTFTASGTGTGGGGGGGGSGGGGGGANDPAGFTVDLVYTQGVSPAQAAVIDAAMGRWTSVITGDVPSVNVNVPSNVCGVPHPAINQTIDDLLVFVHITDIDGTGGVLGSAGPCYIRSGSGIPLIGAIRLDLADVNAMLANGTLHDVVLHELGHVLGVGTMWGPSVLAGGGTGDPYFTGAAARAAFLSAGGGSYAGIPVPVEATGGPGTAYGHWREGIFRDELMTGWISSGGNPLSAVTAASLADIGYSVDLGGADPWSVGGTDASMGTGALPKIRLVESTWTIVPVAVDPGGARD